MSAGRYIFILLILAAGNLFSRKATCQSAEKRTTVPAFMSWFESDIVGKIHGPFSWQTDIQFRTSSNERNIGNGQHGNPWANPFQVVVRPWIHYDLGATGLKFSVSPMGYWATWNYYNGEDTFEPEIRSSFQVQYSSRAGRVYLTNRLRYELRWYGQEKPVNSGFHVPAGSNTDFFSDDSFKQRLRYMFRAWIPLSGKELVPGTWYVSTFDELFIGFGKNVTSQHTFDQNRFYAGLGMQVGHMMRWEVGYMNQVLPRFNQPPDYNNVELNHILATWLFFDNVGALFQKKSGQKK
ncbi:DUF2490 domain-containing protein [Chitinophaga arvensicola]|uniref:Uncharacterized protein n=1 Tax=Chitinophaga arvensicola TaxID=29529 RepID=A0A1I0SAZ0_9BACT|nr:DUF2490 domain-containing protein [Chitinophaga arvensicola]SEW53809.1 Protein of unknown function [Chitinophaga arvensicola]